MGALKGIIEQSKHEEDYQYDIVSGLGFGAINAAVASIYEKGEEKEMIKYLEKIWHSANDFSTHNNWFPGSVAQGFFFKQGFYNHEPMKETIAKILKGQTAKRGMAIGIASINTGEFFDIENLRKMNATAYANTIYAATALPIYYPPSNYDGQQYVDGSAIWPIEVIGPIVKCKEEYGFDTNDIIIDILLSTKSTLDYADTSTYTTIWNLMRYLEISSFYEQFNDLSRAKHAFPNVEFRHVITPLDKPNSAWIPVWFSQSKIDYMIQ